LQRYIQSELNIRHVLFTSDEAISGVRYRAVADWSVLGKKLRGNLARVKNALPTISSDEIKAYSRTGQITLDGIQLVKGDLTTLRYIELPPASEGLFATNSDTDSNVVIKLDLQIHAELTGERLARELINRIQKLRKKAGLQPTDNVHISYRFEDSTGEDIQDAIMECKDMIERAVGTVPTNAVDRKSRTQLIVEEEQVIADTKFLLYLMRP
jgi:isoleucyl-tRNA synthetase